jgi:hypothetical protein
LFGGVNIYVIGQTVQEIAGKVIGITGANSFMQLVDQMDKLLTIMPVERGIIAY